MFVQELADTFQCEAGHAFSETTGALWATLIAEQLATMPAMVPAADQIKRAFAVTTIL